MVAFVEQHRDAYGVESICEVLPITPSTYCRDNAQQVTRPVGRPEPDPMTRCVPTFSASGMTTIRCTARGRCGDDVGDLVHHSDHDTQLGFKGPSQRVCVSSLRDFGVPLQEFSSRVLFAAGC